MSDPSQADETVPPVGSVVWFGAADDPWKSFRLTVTERSRTAIFGNVDEVTAWELDKDHTPVDFAPYVRFYMKWDGCCHVWFGREKDGRKDEHDGYLHLCGARCWKSHLFIMDALYRWAEKAIPMQREVSDVYSSPFVAAPTAPP